MRLVRPGALEFQTTIGTRIGDDPEIVVDGRELEGRIAGNLERMCSIAVELGLDGSGLVQIALDGVEDVVLARARPGRRPFKTPEISLPPFRVDNMAERIGPVLHEVFDILWQTAGWADGSPSFSAGEWAGYNERRNYGFDD